MMTDVACFCGCFYSFDGGAAACPTCGEVAAVTAGPMFAGTGRRSQQERPAAEMNGARQNGQSVGTWLECTEAEPDPMVGIAITPGSGLAVAPVRPGAGRR